MRSNAAAIKMLALGCLACCLLSQLAFAQTTQPVPYGDNPAAGRYYDLNGFRMYTEVYGSGQPLLMIHGNGGSMKAFSQNVPQLSRHFRVILADSRAQGKSVDPDHPLTFEMMADDFSDLLDAMHVPSAYVVGWSDGGINALLLAMRHPEKVKKLVSTGANLWPTADAFRDGLWDGWNADYQKEKDKKRTSGKEKNDWKIFMLDWEQPHISLGDLKKIQCPCLIVCGDHDLISISHTVLIFQNIRHANLWVVPNSGHGTLIEHAGEFDGKCVEFFDTAFVDHG
jgi:pimeloyl-ACP methyl ester carboxylesterase